MLAHSIAAAFDFSYEGDATGPSRPRLRTAILSDRPKPLKILSDTETEHSRFTLCTIGGYFLPYIHSRRITRNFEVMTS
jgi:hypothetical protein